MYNAYSESGEITRKKDCQRKSVRKKDTMKKKNKWTHFGETECTCVLRWKWLRLCNFLMSIRAYEML